MKKVFITALLFHCIALSVIAQVPNYVPANGLVGWWPFNGNANDQSGYGYHGAVTGATLSTDRFGTINSCYEFLGQTQAGSNNTVILTDNVIDIPNYTPTFTTQLTISVWANTYSSSNSSFLQRRTNNDIDYAVEFWNGNPSCHFGNIGVCSSSNTVGFNEWHNYTYVYDGSNIKIYIDGVLSSTCPTSGNIGNNTNIMNFGKYIYYGGFTHYFFFNGKLDDIGIWDRALSPSEIENLYNGLPIQCSTASLPSNLQNGIVGYWPFCGNANDESGNGNNGTVNGATLTNDRFGNSNKAYSFNGTSDFISIGDPVNGLLDFVGGPFSISVWLKSGEADAPIITKQNPSVPNNNGDYNMDIAQGNARMAIGFGSGTGAARHSNAIINDNNWHHIVAVYTSTSIDVFVDGALSNGLNTNIGSHPSVLSNSSQPLLFGKGFNNYLLDGFLDDIGIWNRALTQQEITQLFTGDTVPACSSLPSNLSSGLVGYWPFCGNANDESGNGNNGTVNGATLTEDRLGNPNSAYNFNGTSSYIEVLNSPSLAFASNEITIAFWAKTYSVNQSGYVNILISKQAGSGITQSGFNVFENTSLALGLRVADGNSNFGGANVYNVSNNQFRHFVFTYKIDTAISYLDGVQQSFVTGQGVGVGSNSMNLLFGKANWNNINSLNFHGVLDDIGIWNRALTQQEITQLFTGDTVPACSSLPSNLSAGLVGYWPFCGNANDESGNGNNGTVNGATLISDRFGNQSSAYSFNGINNYIEVPNSSSLVFPNSSQSFSFWINVPVLPNTFGCDMAIFSKTQQNLQSDPTGNSNTGFEVIFGEAPNSNLYHRYKNGSSSNWGYTQISKNMFVTNQWFHVVTIADKSKDSAYAYLNGVLIESKLMGVNTTIGSNALSLLMGKGYWTSNGVPSFYFNGKLDDIGIWNRALTPEEVVELYSGLDTCTTPYYSDLDNDGYGGLLLGNFCSAPPNGVLQSGDCDDANPSINPGVPEICNGVDDDCDGSVDDGLGPILGNISGPAVQCIPLITGQAAFSLPAVPGATNYQWTLPQGMQILSGQGTQNLSVFWNLPSAHKGIVGPLSVTVTGTCGQATTYVDIHLQISIPVRPSSISGPLRVCPGDTATYSVLSVARARNYIWTLPAGMTLIEGEGTNVIKTVVLNNYSGGVLSVSAVNACDTGAVRTKNLLLNTPLTPLAISGQNSGLCKLNGVVYSVIQQPSTLAYNWTVPVGASIVSGQGSNSITVNYDSTFSTGAITVSSQNNCGSSPFRTLNVNAIPAKPGLINGATQICPGVTNQPYSVSTVVGADTYTWSVFNWVTIAVGQGTKNVLLNYPSVPMTGKSINVIAGNSCGNSLPRYLSGINIDPVNCTRLSSGTNEDSFEIYPNPANDVLYVNWKSQMPYQIEIYNLLGVSVLRTVTANQIDISNLTEGVYILKGIVNDKVIVRRFEVVR